AGTNPVAVPAASWSSPQRANDFMPSARIETSSHVVAGDKADWRRYIIDLGAVKAFHLPNGGSGYALNAVRVTAHADRLALLDLSDVALISPANKTGRVPSQSAQSVIIDRREIPLGPWRRDLATGRYVGATAPVSLGAGDHRISIEPPLPLQPSSIYLAPVAKQPADAGTVGGFTTLSPGEYVTDVRGGGLLVWPMSFAPGWQAYALQAHDAVPTGFALYDALHLRAQRLPDASHVAVNGAFNGWRLAPHAARVVLLYAPEAASEFGGLLWMLLSIVVVISALVAARPRP
ncbi:MAG TPA: hypothetical protein VJN22_02545, partial [Candidatus Eremiobacteraceae bacterium]|nr:hypothetical protein [Candidatus Eremiobacteraceae bacterium]